MKKAFNALPKHVPQFVVQLFSIEFGLFKTPENALLVVEKVLPQKLWQLFLPARTLQVVHLIYEENIKGAFPPVQANVHGKFEVDLFGSIKLGRIGRLSALF